MASITFMDESDASDELPEDFEPYVKEWFNERFEELTPPQRYSFDLIHEGENSLICAPTGSGKTLSAFLSALNELFMMGDQGELEDRVYVLYVSPLRALNNDIHRNLEEPLDGIRQQAEEMGYDMPEVRSAVRTGDTSQSERSKMLDTPPHILITTPETLGIILNAPKFREKLKDVKYVITDEIHSLSDNKRGVHLSLSLERLQEMADTDPTRIGLSATQAPIEEIAKYLVGYEWRDGELETRGCNIVDVAASKRMDLQVMTPVDDLIYTPPNETRGKAYEMMHELVQDHESTIIFTNTRAATERVVNTLKNKYPDAYEDNIGAHHSSMSREKRLEVEEKLKNGELKVAATSTSLELGIDIGYTDLVIQMGSPKGVARGVQRIGRSGHKVGEEAKGRMVVMDRDDALECSVLLKDAKEDNLDRVRMPMRSLDVLSQHLVGMACNRKWPVDEAFDVVRRAYNYTELEREDYDKTLDYLAGQYAELEDQNVYGKIWVGEELEEDEDKEDADSRISVVEAEDTSELVFGRRGKMTRVIYMTNIGTIPDESQYRVFLRGSDERVGSLDEEFLDRLTKGDVFVLGGSTYQFQYARGMKVYVDSVPEKSPTVPSWYSEMLPLSYDLGRSIGRFCGKIERQLEMGCSEQEVIDWMDGAYYMDENTAKAIFGYVSEQYEYLGFVPTDRKLLVEKTVDEDNKLNVVFHTIFGREVNDALARVFAHLLSKKVNTNVGMVVEDHGFVLKLPRRPVDLDELIADAADVDMRETLKTAVRKTELMKRRFRHVAGRALMIIRNYKGNHKSVGKQQMKSHFLLPAVEKIDTEFPILKETYREIMEDAMDVEHAKEVVEGIDEGDIEYEIRDTQTPSPFAHNMILQGQSDVIKMEDKKERLQQLHEQVMERIEG
ncbi:MAG: ATP-dependent helicase [Candidatus Nanohaloarchaea archaeon]|nr:ATP-dependent helicase [Candidatus Nanohaloarchaea archaeon]